MAGSLSKGRLWRHDPLERPTRFGDALVSCEGSLSLVDLPRPAAELGEVDETRAPDEGVPVGPLGTMALF